MKALPFAPESVPGVRAGAILCTLRQPRSDGANPKVGEALSMMDTGTGRPFARATCVMRTTMWLDHRGLAKIQHDGLAEDAPAHFMRIGGCIMDAGSGSPAVQELALHQLAVFCGFNGWDALIAYVASGRRADANGQYVRQLFGWGPLEMVGDDH